MPIIGMTKTPDGANIPKLTRLGKLHKGAPKETRMKNGKQYEVVGKDLPYFRVEFAPQFQDLLPTWQSIYGTEPTEFKHVYLLGEKVDEAFENWREQRTATILLHRCDGMTQVTHYDQATHQYVNVPTACCSPTDPETGIQTKGCECKPRGRLKLLFREFIGATGVLGYIEVGTGSINDIMDVGGYLAGIEAMHGSLANIPFIFGRAPREISTPMQERQGNGYVVTGRAMNQKSLFYIQVMPGYAGTNLLPGDEPLALPASTTPLDAETAAQMNEDDREVERAKSQMAEWVNDVKQVELFMAWAKKDFGFDLEAVLVAFDNAVAYDVTNITQWRENGAFSLAAVIANAHAYDLKAIEKVTSQMNRFDVYFIAEQIVERVQAESDDETELVTE